MGIGFLSAIMAPLCQQINNHNNGLVWRSKNRSKAFSIGKLIGAILIFEQMISLGCIRVQKGLIKKGLFQSLFFLLNNLKTLL